MWTVTGPVSDLQENKTKYPQNSEQKGGTSIQERTTSIMWTNRQAVTISACQNIGYVQKPTP